MCETKYAASKKGLRDIKGDLVSFQMLFNCYLMLQGCCFTLLGQDPKYAGCGDDLEDDSASWGSNVAEASQECCWMVPAAHGFEMIQ